MRPQCRYNELICVQPPSRLLLPCRHSLSLNHPEVYKKMWVSWETRILPQLSLTVFSTPFLSLLSHDTQSLCISSLPCLLHLTSFHSASLFSFLHPFFHPLCPLLSALRSPSSDDGGSQHQGKSFQGVCPPLIYLFVQSLWF